MYKRLLILIIMLVVILLMSSVIIFVSFDNYELTDDVWIRAKTIEKVTKKTDASIDELTVYDYEEFRMCLRSRWEVNPYMSSEIYYLQQYNSSFPIEKMKLLDSNTLSVVYKLSTDDGGQVLLALIFERETKLFSKADGVDISGEYESWTKTGEFYYLSDQLCLSDFESVEVGDSVESVKKIDRIVDFDAEHQLFRPGNPPKNVFRSYRLLLDGIAVIEFEDSIDGAAPDETIYNVSSINLYSYSDHCFEYITVKDNDFIDWIFK